MSNRPSVTQSRHRSRLFPKVQACFKAASDELEAGKQSAPPALTDQDEALDLILEQLCTHSTFQSPEDQDEAVEARLALAKRVSPTVAARILGARKRT